MARGVSASKEDVHAAIANVDKGLYPRAFCKIIPDLLGGDPGAPCFTANPAPGRLPPSFILRMHPPLPAPVRPQRQSQHQATLWDYRAE